MENDEILFEYQLDTLIKYCLSRTREENLFHTKNLSKIYQDREFYSER